MTVAKVVFLDRDGTINVDTGYHSDPDTLQLIPGAARAIGELKAAGFKVAIVSNQSAIARGLATKERVEATNEALRSRLISADSRAAVDGFLYCPHGPEDNCECRKPLPGMLLEFSRRWSINLADCWLIGDKKSDLDSGTNCGIPFSRQLLVLTGEGEVWREKILSAEPNRLLLSFGDLLEAAEYIIRAKE